MNMNMAKLASNLEAALEELHKGVNSDDAATAVMASLIMKQLQEVKANVDLYRSIKKGA
jgi:cell division protein ZapA (FtsZ GTPase activity inhibitor)